MEDFYEKNKSELITYYPELFCELDKLTSLPLYSTITTKENSKSLIYKECGKDVLFHSRFYPEKEARKTLVQYMENDPDTILLGGFGLGYYLEKAIELFSDIPIIVIEKDLGILKIALTERYLVKTLKNKNVHLIVSDDHQVLITLLKSLKKNKISIALHEPSSKLYPEFYKKLRKVVTDYTNAKEINFATLKKFHKLWTKNILENAIDFVLSPGVKEFFGKYENKPGILIGAGPSLDKNIDYLHKAKGHSVIVAVNTVYNRLLMNGITPDFVLTVDPQPICAKYFENSSEFDSILVFEPSVSNKVLRTYEGDMLAFSTLFPLVEWLESFCVEKGKLDVGGSVATSAYSLLRHLGCEPIILTGLDLAFSNNSIHSKGTYIEDSWFYKTNKYLTFNNINIEYVKNFHLVEVNGYNGEKVKIDHKFKMYLTWFESMFERNKGLVIDATEGGTYKKFTTQLPLKTAIDKYCTQEVQSPKSLYKTIKYEKPVILNVIDEIKVIIGLLNELKPKIEEAVNIAERLYNITRQNINSSRATNQEHDKLMAKLAKLDNEIIKDKQLSKILSLGIQNVIQSINENIVSMLTKEELVHPKLKGMRHSCLLYSAIFESIEYYITYFQRSITKNVIDETKLK
jgi:hypothetical protein